MTDPKQNSCSICNQQFDSDRELQEHQNQAHPGSEVGKGSGYSESYGPDAEDLKKTA